MLTSFKFENPGTVVMNLVHCSTTISKSEAISLPLSHTCCSSGPIIFSHVSSYIFRKPINVDWPELQLNHHCESRQTLQAIVLLIPKQIKIALEYILNAKNFRAQLKCGRILAMITILLSGLQPFAGVGRQYQYMAEIFKAENLCVVGTSMHPTDCSLIFWSGSQS
jgi:hypothetical protein